MKPVENTTFASLPARSPRMSSQTRAAYCSADSPDPFVVPQMFLTQMSKVGFQAFASCAEVVSTMFSRPHWPAVV